MQEMTVVAFKQVWVVHLRHECTTTNAPLWLCRSAHASAKEKLKTGSCLYENRPVLRGEIDQLRSQT